MSQASPDGFNPYQQLPDSPGRPSSSSSRALIVILGILGGGSILLCCGGGVLLVSFGMNLVATDIENQLRDRPEIKQHIGEIKQFKLNWTKSMANDDEDVWVYEVTGDKGSGELTVRSESTDIAEQIEYAKLRLPGGEWIDIDVAPMIERQ